MYIRYGTPTNINGIINPPSTLYQTPYQSSAMKNLPLLFLLFLLVWSGCATESSDDSGSDQLQVDQTPPESEEIQPSANFADFLNRYPDLDAPLELNESSFFEFMAENPENRLLQEDAVKYLYGAPGYPEKGHVPTDGELIPDYYSIGKQALMDGNWLVLTYVGIYGDYAIATTYDQKGNAIDGTYFAEFAEDGFIKTITNIRDDLRVDLKTKRVELFDEKGEPLHWREYEVEMQVMADGEIYGKEKRDFQEFTYAFENISFTEFFQDEDYRENAKGTLLSDEWAERFICRVKGSNWPCHDGKEENYLDDDFMYYAVGYGEINRAEDGLEDLVLLLYQQYKPRGNMPGGILFHATYTKSGELVHRAPIAGGRAPNIRRNGAIKEFNYFEVFTTTFEQGEPDLRAVQSHKTVFYNLNPTGEWEATPNESHGRETVKFYLNELVDRHVYHPKILGIGGRAIAWEEDPGVKAGLKEYYESQEGGVGLNPLSSGYNYCLVNLDEDGDKEAVVEMAGICGSGGCTVIILDQDESGAYKFHSEIGLFRAPLYVLDSKHNGWNDLAFVVSGGGAKVEMKVLAHEADTYPENPTVEPATVLEGTAQGTAVLIGSVPKYAMFSLVEW